MLPMTTTTELLAKARPNPATGCLEWQTNFGGSKRAYGRVMTGSRKTGRYYRYAHRIVWESIHGPLEKGQCVLHRCDNPRCVNLDHLFVGTQADNMRDMASKGRGGAPRGGRHRSAKLTEEQAKYVLASSAKSSALAKELGTTYQTIYALRTGITWRHLPR